MPDQWLDKLDWADRDQMGQDYAAFLAELGVEWGAVVRERAELVGRDAVLAELGEAFGL